MRTGNGRTAWHTTRYGVRSPAPSTVKLFDRYDTVGVASIVGSGNDVAHEFSFTGLVPPDSSDRKASTASSQIQVFSGFRAAAQ
jgi:hypothetical protein